MLSSARIMMVKDEITEYHGRVEDIRLYDKEPPKKSTEPDSPKIEKKKKKITSKAGAEEEK
jgi:hypothetical protein